MRELLQFAGINPDDLEYYEQDGRNFKMFFVTKSALFEAMEKLDALYSGYGIYTWEPNSDEHSCIVSIPKKHEFTIRL